MISCSGIIVHMMRPNLAVIPSTAILGAVHK